MKTKLEKDIIRLRDEQAGARHDLEKAQNEKKALLVDLKGFCELKIELGQVGVPVDDILQLAQYKDSGSLNGFSNRNNEHFL